MTFLCEYAGEIVPYWECERRALIADRDGISYVYDIDFEETKTDTAQLQEISRSLMGEEVPANFYGCGGRLGLVAPRHGEILH